MASKTVPELRHEKTNEKNFKKINFKINWQRAKNRATCFDSLNSF